MILEACAAEAPKPQSIELLTGIYDGLNALAYRLGDATAILRVERSSVVVRPWIWTDPPPETNDYLGLVPPDIQETVRGWLSQAPTASASTDLGSLLLWASRRRSRAEREHPKDDGYGFPIDVQVIGVRKFNRRLVRELLQTWIEMGTRASSVVLLEETEVSGNPALRITCDDTHVLLTAMEWSVEHGDDPFGVWWSAAFVSSDKDAVR